MISKTKTAIRVTKEGSKQLTLFRARNGYKNLGEALEAAMDAVKEYEKLGGRGEAFEGDSVEASFAQRRKERLDNGEKDLL